ncbi:MAG TPA: cupin domain-containing protein [Thermomicrobiales bacterium]|mgnify:CR=1 FL=1
MEFQAFELADVDELHRQAGKLYYEFLRVPSLSVGLYVLPAGGEDPQTPHREDEVYVVLEGRAVLSVAGEDHPVQRGSIVFVAKEVEHRFHSIEETLRVLVFFAPAHTS